MNKQMQEQMVDTMERLKYYSEKGERNQRQLPNSQMQVLTRVDLPTTEMSE